MDILVTEYQIGLNKEKVVDRKKVNSTQFSVTPSKRKTKKIICFPANAKHIWKLFLLVIRREIQK
jgi:hypothetical protein